MMIAKSMKLTTVLLVKYGLGQLAGPRPIQKNWKVIIIFMHMYKYEMHNMKHEYAWYIIITEHKQTNCEDIILTFNEGVCQLK